MVGRVIIGDKPGFGMGAFVSLPGFEVMTCDKFQLMFSTQWKNMQFVASGSVVVTGTNSTPVFVSLPAFPNQGFLPLILFSCDEWEIYCEYLSNTSARIRRLSFGETASGNTATAPHTCYYIVTSVPFP